MSGAIAVVVDRSNWELLGPRTAEAGADRPIRGLAPHSMVLAAGMADRAVLVDALDLDGTGSAVTSAQRDPAKVSVAVPNQPAGAGRQSLDCRKTRMIWRRLRPADLSGMKKSLAFGQPMTRMGTLPRVVVEAVADGEPRTLTRSTSHLARSLCSHCSQDGEIVLKEYDQFGS